MKNKDGFEPGQILTHADLMKLRARKPAAEPIPTSPEDIDALDKSAVREFLDAHGAEYDGRSNVETLRAQLKEVMFL